MASSEGLAERIRGILTDEAGVAEKRSFGGLAFLLGGNLCVGVVKDELMVRVGSQGYEVLVREPHARKMDFTGRPMTGFLFVAPDGLEADADLQRWVARGVALAKSLPKK